MLKMTKIKLELISGPDMFTFFEKSIKGGISNRYSKAKNINLKTYDSKQKSEHIILRYKQVLRLCNASISSNRRIQMDRS